MGAADGEALSKKSSPSSSLSDAGSRRGGELVMKGADEADLRGEESRSMTSER